MQNWENSHIFRGNITLPGQKSGTSELKLSWTATLTGEPPAVISLPAHQDAMQPLMG